MAKLKEEYKSRIFGELEQKLGLKNKMLVPRLQKVVVNMAFGIVSKDEQKQLVDDLAALTGQKPMLCRAKTLALYSKAFAQTSHSRAR